MGDLQQATITIDEIVEKDNRVKVKAVSGGSYSFFRLKQDGDKSVAYKQMKDMDLRSGVTVDISYDTTQGEYDGKPITYKNIKSFREASVGQRTIQVEPKVVKEETDWDKISWGKCKHAFLVEYLKKSVELADAEPLAEEWADASMRKLEKPVTGNDGLSQAEIDSIPF